jgi:hypothetical protein
VQGQTRVRDQHGRVAPLRSKIAAGSQRWKGRGGLFKDAGWREASAVALGSARQRAPLRLARSVPLNWELLALSKQRAAIAAGFRAWKPSGGQWEASQGKELAHQERVLLGLAFATLLTLLLGTPAAAQEGQPKPAGSRRRTWAGTHRLFRLGREAFWQRLWRNTRTPSSWEVAELDGPNWAAASRAYHAPAGTTLGPKRACAGTRPDAVG